MMDEFGLTRQCPGVLYTILPGDSLLTLARRFNTTVNAILSSNPGLEPTNLIIGQKICIPTNEPAGVCPGGFLYTVAPNDTFYSIARRFGVVVPALQAANPTVNPDALHIGQQICIPTVPPAIPPCSGRLYTIQAGDTFINIARRFGYTVDAILAANPGVNPQFLRIGQEICLPPLPGGGPLPCYGGSIYIIRPGDTLYGIAQRYGVAINRILQANPQIANAAFIQVGTSICIPG